MVTKDVPPDTIVAGNPAKVIKKKKSIKRNIAELPTDHST